MMLLVRDGNKEAYEILMKKYMSQAKAFACKYIHDSYAAEDIVQEALRIFMCSGSALTSNINFQPIYIPDQSDIHKIYRRRT